MLEVSPSGVRAGAMNSRAEGSSDSGAGFSGRDRGADGATKPRAGGAGTNLDRSD